MWESFKGVNRPPPLGCKQTHPCSEHQGTGSLGPRPEQGQDHRMDSHLCTRFVYGSTEQIVGSM